MEGREDDDAPRHVQPRSPRRTALIIALCAPVVLVLALVIAWVVDTSASGGKVQRNVTLAGRDVSRLSEDDLPMIVDEVAEDHASTPVRIVTPAATYETTAGAIGLSVAREATVEEVLDVGRTGAFPVRPFSWLGGFVTPRTAPLQFSVNAETVRSTLIELEGDDRTAPIEPSIAATDDGFDAVPGTPGRGLNAEDIARRLPDAAAAGTTPIVLSVAPGAVAPRFADSLGEEIAEAAEEATDEPLSIAVAGVAAPVAPEQLRTWLTATTTDDGLVLAPDPVVVLRDLRALITELEGAPVDASFTVVGGQVRLIAGSDGLICCSLESPAAILGALQAEVRELELEAVTRPPELSTEEGQALGIVEEIGSPAEFGPTTRHKGGESRVKNIHSIADIVRGKVILPGETFSVNGFVGKRTAARGFVEAGVIYQGRYETDIGGGVSQFATTLFNAALFAGLDFAEYQSHSIQIDRYPRGHEATISYPKPDLQIVNNTPYGVLLWPTYTDTSITVHVYSTRHATVALGEQTSRAQGRCTRWTTPRTRTYPDGSTQNDSVFAVYRPGEGINC